MTSNDLLKYAIKTIEDGPLPDEWHEHGPYCPNCAIAYAKGAIDERDGTCVNPFLYWNTLCVSDLPLIEARERLGDIPNHPLAQDEALAILRAALAPLPS